MILAELLPARSYLYVPGTEREKLDKAPGRGADALIADLEDAVAPDEKADARDIVSDWLARLLAVADRSNEMAPQVWVRVNRDSLADDVRAVASPALAGIVLPKSDPDLVRELDRLLTELERERRLPAGRFAVLPLVETAGGLLAVVATAAGPRVHRLGLGEVDLIGELGLRPGREQTELLPIRLQVVVASAAARIVAPVAPTSTDFRDLDAFRDTGRSLLALGFRGRTAVHPAQVPVINEVFTPGKEEVSAARAVLARFERAGSGVQLDDAGRMLDAAVVRAARDILARARTVADLSGDGPSAE